MKVEFHPEAEEELVRAVDWYEDVEPGLGQDFALEVHAAVRAIASFPTAWPVLDGDIRRCLTNRFPYGLLFSTEKSKVLVLAVMHLHRKPDYWKDRRR
jgi:plasmid stabilization system protein ParE